MSWRLVLVAIALLAGATDALAQSATYNLDALGVPQFVNTNYIDLKAITSVSKFRSNDGHDYSDTVETCRSMKHYFASPDPTTKIYAPVAGTVTRFDNDPTGPGKTVYIASDVQPAFVFGIFHMSPSVAIGDHVAEGQVIGTHLDTQHISDIAVNVRTPTGPRLVSYFETLTDTAFAAFQARGIASRSQFIISKAVRDADPYQCAGQAFILQSHPLDENVHLSSLGLKQTLSVSGLPETSRLGNSPLTVTASTNAGLYISVIALTPSVCTVSGTSVTLLAAGFCSLAFNQAGNADYAALSTTYNTTVVADVYAGPIFSSAQAGARSFLRFFNTGNAAGTVAVGLSDQQTGRDLGHWISPSIPAGAEMQYPISTLETELGLGSGAPGYYTLSVQPAIAGNFQHVLYRPADGSLTNLSTCALGVGADHAVLSGVHSSLVGSFGFPSTVIVNNAGPAGPAMLGIYDARDGKKIGTYTTTSIPANGTAVLDVGVIEAGAGVTPLPARPHYIVKAEGAFSGFLQHLVDNQQPGVMTDMTTACTLDGSTAPTLPLPLQAGAIFSTAQPALQSFVRIFNTGTAAGTVTVTLRDYVSGQDLGQWTSPSIAGGAESQYAISTLESGLMPGVARPKYYALVLQSTMPGSFQHVLWRATEGTLTNLSTCAAGASADRTTVSGVHSSIVGGAGYPSLVAVNNTGNTATTTLLGIYDARDGTKVGTYPTGPIPGKGAAIIDVAAMEAAAGLHPTTGMLHYIVKVEGPLVGYLQHLVNNQKAGVITDMTTVCVLP